CGDPACLEPVSTGRTLVDYPSGDRDILSFKKNVKVIVFSKSAGSREDLWGVEINGVRGYVPKRFVREDKILKRNLDFIVDVNVKLDASDVKSNIPETIPTNYEVIGQTTIYYSDEDKDSFTTSDEITTLKTTIVPEQNIEDSLSESSKDSTSNEMLLQDSPLPKTEEVNTIIKETLNENLVPENVTNSNYETNKVDINVKSDLADDKIISVGSIDKLNINLEINDAPKLGANQLTTPEDVVDLKQEILSAPTLEEKVVVDDISKNIEDGIKIDVKHLSSEEIIEKEVQASTLQTQDVILERIQNSEETENIMHNVSDGSEADIKTVVDEQKNVLEIPSVLLNENIAKEDVIIANASSESIKDDITKEVQNSEDLLKAEPEIKNDAVELSVQINNTVVQDLPIDSEELSTSQPSMIIAESVTTSLPFVSAHDIPPSNIDIKKSSEVIVNEIIEPSPLNGAEINSDMPVVDNKLLNIDYHVKNTGLPVINEIPLSEDNSMQDQEIPIMTPNINIASSGIQNNLADDPLLKGSNKDISNNLKDYSDDHSVAENVETNNKINDIEQNLQFDSLKQDEIKLMTEIEENKVEAKGTVEEINYGNLKENIEHSQQEEMQSNSGNEMETSFFGWVHDLIFTKPESIEIKPDNHEELNHMLDDGHDALLSRMRRDEEVCAADNCKASNILVESDTLFSTSSIDNMIVNSGTTIIYLSVTAITVLLFTLGYYFIEKWRQDGSLLRKVNTLEQALMVSSKECEILREKLDSTQTKLTSIKEGAFGSNEEVISLQEEKKKLEATILDKERQLMDLQKEFEAATETGLELNKMLQDMMMTAQKGDTIAESMEHAQLQLNEQKETINSMSAALATRNKENNDLQSKLNEYEKQIETVQKLLNQEKSSNLLLKEEQLKYQEQLQPLQDQLLKIREENAYEIQQVRSVLTETQRDLYTKTNQVQLLEDCIKKLKSGSQLDVTELADIAGLRSDLQRTTTELQILKEHDAQESLLKKKLEENVKTLMNEIEALKEEHHKAEKDKMEAQTRLEVLSGYFKEKETQLQKELGIQEALWQQKQGEATSTVERLHSMQDEIQSLKSQNQSLHSEIEQQAAAHRSQVTALESRIHEAWLNSRQTQRKLEESRQEASSLRRKLTSLVEQENMQKRGSSPLEVQLSAQSPILMNSAVSPILPPPPLPFLPPPFLPPPIGNHAAPPPHFMPPFMGDMRPPPLGRLPSPPRQRRGHYSPSMASERYSPESRAYSPESRAYSPDSRAYSPDYRRPISPYDTETDISPPTSPYRNKYNSHANRRDDSRKLSKGMISAESNETVNRNGRNHTSKAV
ncbi:transport and Golgi organization protein 1-like, partial [Ctenocephalides felis]|uniref:transport and Golgi organization protein 1-like n=1 Tax=Ctenocephalides felis TaxID=7515 RepID=UPI000E6E5B14